MATKKTAKKAAPKKAAPKKAAAKKAAPKKASPKKAAPRKASPKKASPKKAAPKKAAAKKAATQASKKTETVDINEALTAAASQVLKKGSARVRGLGKFSIRAAQSRKGVKRRVVLRLEPEFQAAVGLNESPESGVALALVETLGNGEALRINGLGSFSIVDRPATTGLHPRTRKTLVIPARRVLEFNGATLKK